MTNNDHLYRTHPPDDVHDVLSAKDQLEPLMQECVALTNENLWLRVQLDEAKARIVAKSGASVQEGSQ